MSNRVCDSDVKAIRPDIPSDLETTPWISAANCVVDTINTECGASLTEAKLTQVELWLAAHYVSSIAPTASSESFEGWSKTFNVGSTTQTGVMSDSYGRMANTLSGGCLQQLDKPKAFGYSI